MKQNDIQELPALESSRFENIFNIHQTDTGEYYYNILNSITFNVDDLSPSIYTIYTVAVGDTYPLISYKKYSTINLWWLICSVNNIKDSTKLPEPGTLLRIIDKDVVVNILAKINK